MKREQYANRARNEGIRLSEYIWRGIEIEPSFIDFAQEILAINYDQTPDYDLLVSM